MSNYLTYSPNDISYAVSSTVSTPAGLAAAKKILVLRFIPGSIPAAVRKVRVKNAAASVLNEWSVLTTVSESVEIGSTVTTATSAPGFKLDTDNADCSGVLVIRILS